MDSNFETLSVMVVMICQSYVLILVILLLSLIKGDYRCIVHDISKSEAINLLENSVLEDRGFI